MGYLLDGWVSRVVAIWRISSTTMTMNITSAIVTTYVMVRLQRSLRRVLSDSGAARLLCQSSNNCVESILLPMICLPIMHGCMDTPKTRRITPLESV